MLAKATLVFAVLALCAGCATGAGPTAVEPSVSSPSGGQGFALPFNPETPRCSWGATYNRATGLCLSPGGS